MDVESRGGENQDDSKTDCREDSAEEQKESAKNESDDHQICLYRKGPIICVIILLTLVGVILIVVGYVDKPSFPKESALYKDKLQRLEIFRTIGWVLSVIGVLVLLIGCYCIYCNANPSSGDVNTMDPDRASQGSAGGASGGSYGSF